MTTRLARSAAALALGLSTTLVSHAESFASSASSAGSASLGSSSDSIRGSSNSSSGDKKVADGDYRVIDVAAAPERAGMLRVQLQAGAAAADGDTMTSFYLDLPRQALGERMLAAGDTVGVRNRPYGLEFARAADREAFFLVLKDDWRGELDAHPVAL